MSITLAKYEVIVAIYFDGNFFALISYILLFHICGWFLLILLTKKAGFSVEQSAPHQRTVKQRSCGNKISV
jgi:hypothetical protein